MSEESKPPVRRYAVAVLAGVGAFVIAIVLVGFGLVAWEHFSAVRNQLADVTSQLNGIRATVDKIDTITGDIHTFTYKTMSDLDIDRAKAGKK